MIHAFVCFALDVWDEVKPIDSEPSYVVRGCGKEQVDTLRRESEQNSPVDEADLVRWQASFDEWASTKPRSMSDEELLSSWLYFGNPPRPGTVAESSVASLREVEGWRCWLQQSGVRTEFEFTISEQGSSSPPLEKFAEILDRLSLDGWTVVHIAEDRTIRSGEAMTTADLIRLRILVTKP